jgi:16S rRNA (uracil1498-N3)-methyltransferase
VSDALDVLRRASAHLVVDDLDAPMLDDDAQHHLFRVLRLRDGESVTVTDGAGSWRECCVAGDRLEPIGDVGVVARRIHPITIALAIPKHDRPEWIVQKLTELGVDRIVVLDCDRSVVRWDVARATKHLHKLRRVALEAIHQCRGVWLPSIEGPLPALEVVAGAVVAEPGGREVAADDRTIAIGPEGGWSDRELAAARDRVSLGRTILRVETAAITAGVRSTAFDPGV